jgi:hypothetical protein
MKTNTSAFARDKSFLGRFSKFTRRKNKEFSDRVAKLIYYIDNMENGGAKILNSIKSENHFVDVKRSQQSLTEYMINSIFPNCHGSTKRYILNGYILKAGWEKELRNYLQDDRINVLNNELIFILFSTKMPIEDFLELTKLPTNYIARFLQ